MDLPLKIFNMGIKKLDERQQVKAIERDINSSLSSKNNKKLKEVCYGFEAIFIEKLWQEMKKTLPKGGLFEDKILENYLSIFDMEFAKTLAKDGGIGLSDLLYKNLKSGLEERSRWIDKQETLNKKAISQDQKKQEEVSFKKFIEKVNTIHRVENLSKTIENKRLENKNNFILDKFIMPVKGKISSHFGWRRDPFTHHWAWHNGIDISVPYGTPVKASKDGVVIFADNAKGYGNLVIIKHPDGFKTYYAHLSKIFVRTGEKIEKGKELGKVGNSGRSTGPHLHFEIRFKDTALDPEHIEREIAFLKLKTKG